MNKEATARLLGEMTHVEVGINASVKAGFAQVWLSPDDHQKYQVLQAGTQKRVIFDRPEEDKKTHVWCVDLYWSMLSHPTDLAEVISPDQVRFIGTYEECEAYVRHFQSQQPPLARKKLHDGTEVRFRDIMRTHTLIKGVPFMDRLRILLGAPIRIETETYLMIPYPFRAISQTGVGVDRLIKRKPRNRGGMEWSPQPAAQCSCGHKFWEIPAAVGGWVRFNCHCGAQLHRKENVAKA